MPPNHAFTDAVASFAASLTANFASSVAAQPEDQLKTPVKTLLENSLLGRRIVVRTEAHVAGLSGRPDLDFMRSPRKAAP